MHLSPQEVEHFEREGYLFFPGLFSAAEMQGLQDEVPRLFAQQRPENVREKDREAVRTNFAAQLYSRPLPAWRDSRAWSSPSCRSSVKRCTCTSSRSTARWHSATMSGSGTRTMAPGSATTRCPNRGR